MNLREEASRCSHAYQVVNPEATEIRHSQLF